MRGRAMVLALWTLLAAQALAADPATPPSPSMDTVTVKAARDPAKLRDQIDSFVTSIVRNARTDSLARWYVPICPLVAGLSREKAEYFLQRVSDVARAADAPLAPEQCSPNLLIVISSEPNELLSRWRDKTPRLFSKSRGPFAIKRFMESTLPVRVWYNAGDDCATRMATFDIQSDVLSVACRTSGMASRLSRTSLRTVNTAIVVVDKEQMKGFKVGQIADYIAMVGLAELVEPDESLPVPTVLDLFVAGAPRVGGMTEWDQSFLHSLYHSNPRNAGQASEIRGQMFKDAVAAEPAP